MAEARLQTVDDEELESKTQHEGFTADDLAALFEPIGAEDMSSEDATMAKETLLDSFGLVLADLRREAIIGRDNSGIELEWAEDEEFYEGIDDANRGEIGAYRSKPPGQPAITDEDDEDDSTSSTVFPNITRPYCDAASSRVGQMLLPIDDRPFAIKPTPVPELMEIADAKLTPSEIEEIEDSFGNEADSEEKIAAIEQAKAEKLREKMPAHIAQQIEAEAQAAFGNEPDYQQRLDQAFAELAESIAEDVNAAKESATKAETRIDDWHVEGQYHAEVRKVIDSSTRMGTGVLKGPIPRNRKRTAYKAGKILIEEVIKPVSKWINIWSCYPDPGCGDSIHDGSYHFQRDDITHKNLAGLRVDPNYIESEINRVLTEGPHKAEKEVKDNSGGDGLIGLVRRDTKQLYEIWYGYVNLTRENFMQAGIDLPESFGEHPIIAVEATMVNNHVIKLIPNLLDTGEFPYDYMVWQRRSGLPYGIGVARQLRAPQRIVTAALRNMMDNAGLAGGPMWYYLDGVFEPMDGNPEIRPRKGWRLNRKAANNAPDLIQHGIGFIKMDMMQEELERIIQMALRLAEDVTGLPSIMQGQQGKAPDTVGGMTILNNNASTVLRRIAQLFDDLVTEPHVRRYYSYLLQYGEDDDEKGEFVIDARGSSALVERDISNESLREVVEMSLNPIFGIDPKRAMEEWQKSRRIDPLRLAYEDEKWRETVEKMAAQAEQGDTSVEVAGIRKDQALEVEEMRSALKEAQMTIEKTQHDEDNRLKIQQAEATREIEMAFKALDQELQKAQDEGQTRMEIEKLKERMAELVMKLQAQFKMQRMEGAAAELTEPAVEPTPKAPAGHAFAQ